MLANEVRNGIISIGRQINPKLSVKNNMIEKEQFTVEGRKHALLEICQKLLTKHRRFMRLNNDEYFENLDQQYWNKD